MIAFCFRGETAAAEHRRLRDCALARDARQAIAVLEEHIGGCVDYTLATGVVGWLAGDLVATLEAAGAASFCSVDLKGTLG